MNIATQRVVQSIAISALVLGLAACGKTDDNKTAGQKLDNAIERTENAADNAKVEADRAAANASQSMNNAAESVKETAKEVGDATKEAAGNVAAAADAAATTAKVNAALVGDPELSALKINVDTKDGAVLLKGEAPSQSAKDRATDLAKAVQGVISVDNQLTLKP